MLTLVLPYPVGPSELSFVNQNQVRVAQASFDRHPSPPEDSYSLQASFHNSKPTSWGEGKRRGGRNER